jgi:hypothetical protein
VAAFVLGGTVVRPARPRPPRRRRSGRTACVSGPGLDQLRRIDAEGFEERGSFDAASQDAINGLDTATNQLESSLEQLGKPSTSNGAKAQSAIENLSTELSGLVDNVKQELANPPSDPWASHRPSPRLEAMRTRRQPRSNRPPPR